MDGLMTFLEKLNQICNGQKSLSIEQAREVIKEINGFLFANNDGIGTTVALDSEYEYFSEFHKYWEKNYKELLDLKVDRDRCEQVADVLHEVYQKTNGRVFTELYNTNGLSKEEICQVRFLTANQDFRGSRNFKELSDIYKKNPDVFDVSVICEKPESFLGTIKATGLSQTDKRLKYAKTIALFLQERKTSPYELLSYYQNDVYKLREELINCPGSGYANKKADMFIRDMVVFGVWEDVKGFDKIDVASDVNTIKIALRTGILTSAIPLLSSFLDIFGYQYSYVDEMNAKAWRTVWEIWKDKYSDKVDSPSLLDYFVYQIVGKTFCKENLYMYKCENGHEFYGKSATRKKCIKCNKHATYLQKQEMCEADDASIVTEEVLPEYTNCPFKPVCDKKNCKKLEPPKSISILGKTGWTTAYSRKENGGGGLMA